MSQTSNYRSNASPSDAGAGYEELHYIIRTMLAGVRTSTPVQVVSVTNTGGVSPVGFVDIKPLVNQITGNGEIVEHGVIYNVPYLRIQGGGNAVIIDPKVGDIGLASFCDRDISTVKSIKGKAAPNSRRRHDMSDAVYLATILSGTPTQYVQFNDSGITIHSPATVSISCETATITANSSCSVTAPAISLGASGQTLSSLVTSAMSSLFNDHTHLAPGGTTGTPNQTMGSGQLTTTIKGG